MEEITTLHALIFTHISLHKIRSMKLIEITENGPRWPSKVSHTQVSSHLIEPSLNTAVKSGILNQCQFHIHQLTPMLEPKVLLTFHNLNEELITSSILFQRVFQSDIQ